MTDDSPIRLGTLWLGAFVMWWVIDIGVTIAWVETFRHFFGPNYWVLSPSHGLALIAASIVAVRLAPVRHKKAASNVFPTMGLLFAFWQVKAVYDHGLPINEAMINAAATAVGFALTYYILKAMAAKAAPVTDTAAS